MTANIILLFTPECNQALLTALALCLVPFLLGWLAAYIWHKVPGLRQQNTELTGEVNALTGNVSTLTGQLTELRVKHTQDEAEIERLNEALRKARTDLMLCEGERNALREQAGNASKGSSKGGAAAAVKHDPIMFAGKKWTWDNLEIVEGIGPKIAAMLRDAGIKTWEQLADAKVDSLREILDAGGPAFNIADPGSWPKQAALAAAGKWDALKKLQDELMGGK